MLSPRKFKDVNGLMAEPDKGFILTTEVLRRKPDSALIWYEDFRDDNPLPSSYWTALSGEWQVWQNQNDPASRPYSQLDGYGQVAWKYSGFSDVHCGQGWPLLQREVVVQAFFVVMSFAV